MLNKAEARVETWIRTEFGTAKKRKKAKGDDDRADFFCVAVGEVLEDDRPNRGDRVPPIFGEGRQIVVRRFGVYAHGPPAGQILFRSSSFLPMTMRWISDVPSPISSSGASR